MFLVGEGAYKWAKSKGMDLLESTSEANSWLVTENARTQWVKYTSLLANSKKLLELNTDSGSEHDSVQLEAPGYLHVYLLLILFELHFELLLICSNSFWNLTELECFTLLP